MTILFFIPTEVFAVDYNITNVEIHAYLQPNGDVTVHEQHTYEFSGEFGGIIRELIPKERTEIVELEAFEDNKPLRIETDKTEHRIHRGGKDETISINLTYKIKNGVDIYVDVAEFYWPFFDKRNEATYGNLTVYVIPPEPTTALITFGYDEAYKTESVLEDGRVQFAMGEVPRKRNGDIRVAYTSELFPTSSLTANKLMYDEIVAAKQHLLDTEIAKAARKEQLSSIGIILVPLFALLLLFVLVKAWLDARNDKAVVMGELKHTTPVPKETLSLPTTICFMNYQLLEPETTVAALLDLVRKGHVKKLENDRFRLVNKSGLLHHEENLVRWLFHEVGSGDEFHLDDIEMYLKNKKNHQTYQQLKADWEKEVRAEIKEAGLYKNKVKYRLTVGFISILLIPFIILFAIYGLNALVVTSIVICLGLLLFAICYYPKTMKGLKLTLELRQFKQEFPKLIESTWQLLSDDDKMRAFIIGIGSNEKELIKKNESLINTFKTKEWQSSTVYGFDPSWLIIAAAAKTNFRSAEKNAGIDGSSSGFTGGGSGTGGGGGGSGAF